MTCLVEIRRGALKDAYYFSHDANARRDLRINELIIIYGYEGYGWYWALVEMMREQADYKLKINGKYSIQIYADELKTTSEKASEFIQDCINEFKLFVSDGEQFWSESLLRRMAIKEETHRKLSEAGQRGGKASGEARVKPGLSDPQPIKERKGKETKERKNTCAQVLAYLNKITGRQFKVPGENMEQRLTEGHTKAELMLIIRDRWERWKGTEMEEYVRPSTLFRPSHFNEYLAEATKGEKKKVPACPKCGRPLINEIKNRSSHCYNPECDADIRSVYESQ